RSEENADFLKGLYDKIRNESLKEKIIFSLSQQSGFGNDKWILDIATNTKESVELRKKALFWAGQNNRTSMEQLTGLWSRMPDRELREQLIFVYSQRRDRAAVDKLMEIAENEKDRDLRQKAVFWLGQSRDPRVAAFLLKLIEKQ